LDVQGEVARLRADVVGGASAVARLASGVLERAAGELPALSTADLLVELTALALRILNAQPAMAPLVTLAREVLGALDSGRSLEESRRRAAEAAAAFRAGLDRNLAAAAERAAALLPPGQAVLTLSASSAVEATLAEAARHVPLQVVCLEGRPMNEGRLLAAALAARGLLVTLAVDAALESVVGACGALLLGADSIGDAGIVNKIGSAAACHAAVRRGIPVIVVAESSKLLPPGFPQRTDDDRPTSEVWREHGNVQVWNRYFELFPGSLVDRVVTELGSFDPPALDRRRAGLFVPASLSRWASSRA
jgi:translation initiation factor 2B subunit (eIF-2B alpha/beta/delta family)